MNFETFFFKYFDFQEKLKKKKFNFNNYNIIFLKNNLSFIIREILYLYRYQFNNRIELIKNCLNLYDIFKLNNLELFFKEKILKIGLNELPFFILKLNENNNLFLNEDIKSFLSINDLEKIIFFPNLFFLKEINFENNYNIQIVLNLCKNDYNPLLEKIEYGWLKNTLIYYLKYDNQEEFEKLYKKDFNEKKIRVDLFECFLKPGLYNLLDLSAFYCSIKCMKFLILNNVEISSKLIYYLFTNYETIDFITILYNTFDYSNNIKCFNRCIKFRLYNIFDFFSNLSMKNSNILKYNNFYGILKSNDLNLNLLLFQSIKYSYFDIVSFIINQNIELLDIDKDIY